MSLPMNNTSPVCLKEEFSCHDGTCIADSLICNDIEDCANGLDEVLCIERPLTGCPPNEKSCGTTQNCYPLGRGCDGINDCINGEDEVNCAQRSNSQCLVSQFECPANASIGGSSVSFCVPLRKVCDCEFDCPDGADEENCAPFIVTMQPDLTLTEFANSTAVLMCQAVGYPTPVITWLKDLKDLEIDSRFIVVSVNGSGILYIRNVSVYDEGVYSCVISQSSLRSTIANVSTNLTVIDANRQSCRDVFSTVYQSGDIYYDIETIIDQTVVNTSATDITFIVDESGSMERAHMWVREIVPLLESSIRGQGVGISDKPNQYALVGFGNRTSLGGRVLTQLTSVDGFVNATRMFETDGIFEDGYSAILFALNNIPNRMNTTRLYILVTDEARQALPNSNFTRQQIERRLIEENIVLNVVVSQRFIYNTSNNESTAFGLHFNGTAFAVDPLASLQYRTYNNGVIHPNRNLSSGTTYEDYVQLAFLLHGSGWSIQVLNTLSNLTPFSNAFIQLNVDEIVLQRKCLVCTCGRGCTIADAVSIDTCAGLVRALTTRIVPSVALVQKGSSITLTCVTTVRPSYLPVNWTFISQFGSLCNSDRVRCNGNKAFIENISDGDTGPYSCRGRHDTIVSDFTGLNIRTVVSPAVNISLVQGIFKADKFFTLRCTTQGSPMAVTKWRKITGSQIQGDFLLSSDVNGASTITFNNIQAEHTGLYECSAINCVGVTRSTYNVTVTYDTCNIPDGARLSPGEQKLILHTPASGADIILLVDESGSMNDEYQWIGAMVKDLDSMLKKLNIGVAVPNLFSVVGFGSSYLNNRASRVLEYNEKILVPASNVSELIKMLFISGRSEDGYAALKHALDVIPFRSGNAKQFILISDESREPIQLALNQSYLLSLFESEDVILNVAVSQSFQNNAGQRAFGIDSSNRTFAYSPFNVLNVYSNGKSVKDSAHCSTDLDYTELALLSGGAAWDLNILRSGGDIARHFTDAFVLVKAREIYHQISRCINCSCDEFKGTECVDVPLNKCNLSGGFNIPEVNETNTDLTVTIIPERQMHIEGIGDAMVACFVNGSTNGTIKWSFNGGSLPRQAAVTNDNATLKSTLYISPVLKSHKGSYSCFVFDGVKNGVGNSVIEVMSQTLFGLEVYPRESQISVNTSHTIVCNTTVPSNISWEHNYGPLPDNVLVNQSISFSVLTIIDANSAIHSGRYSCVAETITGLSSTDALVYVIEQELQIFTEEKIVDAIVGENATLLCKLECCIGAQLSWSGYNNRDLPSNAQVRSRNNGYMLELHFNNVSVENCNLYVCEGRYKGMRQYVSAHLIVKDAFTIKTNTEPSVLLYNGHALYYILCEASDPVQFWSWSFNETFNLTHFSVLNNSRSILILDNLTLSETGFYTCQALSFDGRIAHFSTFIQVLCNDTSGVCLSSTTAITSSTSSVSFTVSMSTLTEISTVMASSADSIVPSPTITLSSDSTYSISSLLTGTEKSSFSSMAFSSFNSLSTADFTSASPSPTLPPLIVNINPASEVIYIMPGESLNISCITNVATVKQWLYPDSSNVVVTMIDSLVQQLQISDFSVADNEGEYSCIATRNGISVSKNFTITDGTLIVHVEFESQSLDPGSDLNVSCTTTVPVTVLEWKYLRNENELPSNVRSVMINSRTAVLVIDGFISGTNNGAYRCEAIVNEGSHPVSNQVQINSKDFLSLTVSPSSFERAISDDNDNIIRYQCRVNCTCGGAKVFWEGNPPHYIQNDTSTDPTMRVSTLTINRLPQPGTYIFTCVIQQKTLGELRSNVSLKVFPEAKVDVYPEEIIRNSGENHTFTCISNRHATFHWSYGQNNGMLPQGTLVQSINSTVSLLKIINVRRSVNTGTYNCHALYSTAEVRTDGGNLVEREPESLAFNPVRGSLNVTVGSDFSVSCTLNCSCGGYSVQWVNIDQIVGLSVIRHPTGRQALLQSNGGARLSMSGAYTCEMRGPSSGGVAPFVLSEIFIVNVFS
uniref:Uncharacterized protein n=1 Tax=Amphimedon queenslandica TaxID=400682 RepID=A0A1X7UV50_AMPQE